MFRQKINKNKREEKSYYVKLSYALYGVTHEYQNKYYLKNRLASTKNKINSTLDGTFFIVVSSLNIPQSVLQSIKAASIESRFITTDHGRHCGFSRVIQIWIVECILFSNSYEEKVKRRVQNYTLAVKTLRK